MIPQFRYGTGVLLLRPPFKIQIRSKFQMFGILPDFQILGDFLIVFPEIQTFRNPVLRRFCTVKRLKSLAPSGSV